MGSDVKIARALISVTDKTGVVDFARTLVDDFGVEIISTGGTARAIEDAGVPVTPIEEFTGYPEMMDGRVKTLHPKVHGALLARRDSEQHMQEAAQHGIKLIDLVVVNLYEFEKTVANPEVTFADAIEHIDIGGPSMLRSAAKNAASVTVISDPADYDAVLAEMRETGGCTTLSTRRRLQVKVYQTTAAYDTAISRWLAAQASDVADTSAKLEISLEKVDDLRYGENPQQKATVYRFAEGCENTASSQFPLVGSEQIQGKPLSYNNYLDADAAWNLVREFDEPACVILKHQPMKPAGLIEPAAPPLPRTSRLPTTAPSPAIPRAPSVASSPATARSPMSWLSTLPIRTSSSSRSLSPRAIPPRHSSAWSSAPTCACWLPAAWTTVPRWSCAPSTAACWCRRSTT